MRMSETPSSGQAGAAARMIEPKVRLRLDPKPARPSGPRL